MKLIVRLILLSAIAMIQILPVNSAQLQGKIYGIDENKQRIPLSGATVQWLGTTIGALSMQDGLFEIIRNNKESKLIVSYIGYGKDTIEVPVTKSFLEIELNSELELGEVTVTGRQGTIVSKADIAKSEQITMQGLRKGACCNLSESFQTNASVDVEYTDAVSGAKQIQLLGLVGSYTQMMTEQIPNLRGIGATYGMNYIPGPWMESIQISKGASSVTTGFESITGQINVEYKKPTTSEPLYINFYGNQFGRMEGDLNSKYSLTDELSTMIFLHGNRMGQKLDFNNDNFLDLPMDEQINAMNRWNYVTDKVHIQAAAKALYEDRQGGQTGYYSNVNPDSFYGMNVHTERYEALMKSGIIFDGESYKSLALILSAVDHKQNSLYGKNDYSGRQKSLYANLFYQFAFETELEETKENESENSKVHSEKQVKVEGLLHNINTGLSWQFDEYNEMFMLNKLDRTENVPGVFAEYTLKGFYNLTLVGGIRADFTNLYGAFITPRIHLRYEPTASTIIRASAGKGYHTANIFAENTGIMASNRQFVVQEKIKPEEAWNYGLNLTTDFYIGNTAFTLNAEYYRTDFINQVIVDIDKDVHYAYFYNLNGTSYSNSFQVDLTFELFDGFELITAYRLNDVMTTYHGMLEEKPFVKKHKAFLNLAYTLEDYGLLFDFTFDYNGGGRLPNTSSNPKEYRLNSSYPAYILLHSQITKEFEYFSLYIGAENISDYKQSNPILGWKDPLGLNNPLDKEYFDSSMIWAPIVGRVIYAGLRFNLD